MFSAIVICEKMFWCSTLYIFEYSIGANISLCRFTTDTHEVKKFQNDDDKNFHFHSLLCTQEFEITLVKQQGSLGFTLQKEDEAIDGHYVRALVREPATSDGRIQSGDKILAVNGVSVVDMTHEQAVIFLRQQPDAVRLRLFRDDGQLSVSATSPSDSDYRSYAGTNTSTMKRAKANLRPEAINLLSDLASRKNTQSSHSSDGNSDNSSFQSLNNTTSSPRRLRKNVKSSVRSGSGESDTNNSSDTTIRSNNSSMNIHSQTYIVSNSGNSSGTMTPYSDSSADTLTVIAQTTPRMQYYDPHELVAIIPDDDDAEGYYDSDELEKLEQETETSSPSSNASRARRPETLNVGGGGTTTVTTPVIGRKPFYQFSIATANAYELNNLDNAVLDAPTSYKMGHGSDDGDQMCDQDNTFISLPCETLLLACKTEDDLRKSGDNSDDTCLYVTKFNRNQPLYQSAQVQLSHRTNGLSPDGADGGEMNMLKWKGVTMAAENEAFDDDVCSVISSMTADTQSSLPSVSAVQRISIRNAQKDLNLKELGVDSNTHNVSVQCSRSVSCKK